MAKDKDLANEIASQITAGISTSVAVVLTAAAPAVWPLILPAVAGAGAWVLTHRLLDDQRERAERFVTAAEQIGQEDFEALCSIAAQSINSRHFFAHASSAAIAARDEWVIDALASLFVDAMHDTTKIDDHLLIVDVLRQLEPLHVRSLRVLCTFCPFVPTRSRAGALNDLDDGKTWPRAYILQADPGLHAGIDAVLGRLLMLGVVGQRDQGDMYYLTPLGEGCAKALEARGAGDRKRPIFKIRSRPARVEFREIDKSTLMVLGQHLTYDIRASLVDYLRTSRSFTFGEAHGIADSAKIQRSWWGDAVGFAHDCSEHGEADAGPHCGSFELKIFVTGIPEVR